MTTTAIGPIIAAAVALLAAVLVGDLLTVTGRLRRKLEKELSIFDKLPAGVPKKLLGDIVKRQALELVWRENNRRAAGGTVAILVGSLVAMVVNVFIPLIDHARHPNEPSKLPSDPGTVYFPFLVFLVALLFLRDAYKARRDYLEQMDPDLGEPSHVLRASARRSRDSATPAPGRANPPPSWWQRVIAARPFRSPR